jgi:hypothetical protein
MNASLRARSATGIAALLLSGLLAGCNNQEGPTAALAVADESTASPSTPPVGSAAAKGAELSAVVTVRAWIDARNRAVRTGDSAAVDDLTGRGCGACGEYLGGDPWSVAAARVTRHTVRSATVRATINGTQTRRHVAREFEFEVSRVAGESVITKITRVP